MAEKSATFSAFKKIRNSLRRFFPGVFVLGKGLSLIYSRRSFLRSSGFFKSVSLKRPCRADGSPIPWMNYAMVAFLEDRLRPDQSMFEYGSGGSTLFFAARMDHVTSLECDRDWYNYVNETLPDNVTLLLADKGTPEYVATIANSGERYDIVVVDAEERIECLRRAPEHLSERGVVLLDDADREQYRPGIEHLRAQGFRELAFNGLKPGGIRAYRTSVFYRDGNCLEI